MPVELNTNLNEEQATFAIWVEENSPYLLPLFDFENAAYKPEAVERYLGTASHGEAIMARFVLSVWRHSNDFDFDFVEAAATLDKKQMKVITEWLKNPFWP